MSKVQKTNKELRRKIRNEKEKFYDQFVSANLWGRLAMAWNFFDSAENVGRKENIKFLGKIQRDTLKQEFYGGASSKEFITVLEAQDSPPHAGKWEEKTILKGSLAKKLTNAEKQAKQGLKRPRIPTEKPLKGY